MYETGEIEWTGAWASMEFLDSNVSVMSGESPVVGQDLGYLSPRARR